MLTVHGLDDLDDLLRLLISVYLVGRHECAHDGQDARALLRREPLGTILAHAVAGGFSLCLLALCQVFVTEVFAASVAATRRLHTVLLPPMLIDRCSTGC